MRVAVEEAVPEDHRHPDVRHPVGELAALLAVWPETSRSRSCDAVQALEREHPCRRVAPYHLGITTRSSSPKLRRNDLGVARLVQVVELLAGSSARTRRRAPSASMKSSARTRSRTKRAAERISVRSDSIWRGAFGSLHLDDDVLARRQRRAMHLADRGGGDRCLVEREKRALDGEAELLLDHLLDVGERHRRDVVLELAQLGDDVERHDVRPGREQLAELDERRPELVEHLAQPAPAVGRAASVVGPARRRSTTYPKPWRVATRPISERRPSVRWGCAVSSSVSPACSTATGCGLEQPDAVLELRDPQRRDRRSPRAARAGAWRSAGRPARRGGHRAELLRLAAPARERVAHGSPQVVALEPDEAREVVGEVVGGLGGQRSQPSPASSAVSSVRGSARARLGCSVPVHARSVRGRAAAPESC